VVSAQPAASIAVRGRNRADAARRGDKRPVLDAGELSLPHSGADCSS
jgi:hypothetical protein